MSTGYAINEDQARICSSALSDLAVQSEANSVLLTDIGGNILASVAKARDGSITTVGALAAGSFAATREMAAIIGEPSFHAIYHQGENTSIYMQGATAQFLIVVIFDRNTTAGLVKLYVGRTIQELRPLLEKVEGQSVAAAQSPSRPERFEMDLSASIFGSKAAPAVRGRAPAPTTTR
jgi:predicted regulator of Ras-like GTPase activity (Roadblock/LC7/MglB family)